ncbi:UDP-2,4-diacetamido-2,4,6-trideoxy-beta-L-altropyranose hydrolase [Chloroflexota bacterium]
MMESLFIRVDAGTQMGTGHLMRCLALAQAWKAAGGQATFITAYQGDGLLRRIREEGFELHVLPSAHPDASDWINTSGIMAADVNALVVLDGYHFDEDYQQQVKDAGYRLLVIDDMAHLKHYYADIVLNQNLHAEQLHYSCESYTRLLLGTQYVLLRREFLVWRGWRREVPDVARHILVTMGGCDTKNHTFKVIKALRDLDISDLEATIIIGMSNPHGEELETAAKGSRIPINLIRNAGNMPELMGAADVAVCTAGTTVWELAFMGTPTIAAATTPIEEFLVSELEKQGLFYNLNWLKGFSKVKLADALNRLIHNKEVRGEMSKSGQHFVDGNGCDKVVKLFSNRERRDKME